MPTPVENAPYRVIELSEVSDRAIEQALNAAMADGYRFESINFVTQHGSRRPTMAFLFFTRAATGDGG
ncbi:MAG TPA: hypothetical protein VGK27_06465 [Candidatus Deferrimicrobiaceae bacterium]